MKEGENTIRITTKAESGILSKVVIYGIGTRVEIPVNKDGSVKYFDDTKLLKKKDTNWGRNHILCGIQNILC